MYFDYDLLTKEAIWHLLTYHKEDYIKPSSSGSAFHVMTANECDICRMFEDPKHAFVKSATGNDILYINKRRKSVRPFKWEKSKFNDWFHIGWYFRINELS